MVTITKEDTKLTFTVVGFHKFLALEDKIIVDIDNIVRVYQDIAELKKFAGWRIGTYIPFVITAGRFTIGKKTNFWDVCNKKNTIIVELKKFRFNKLYIEVENPADAMTLLYDCIDSNTKD